MLKVGDEMQSSKLGSGERKRIGIESGMRKESSGSEFGYITYGQKAREFILKNMPVILSDPD